MGRDERETESGHHRLLDGLVRCDLNLDFMRSDRQSAENVFEYFRVSDPSYETFFLAVAVGLLFWALAGGVIVRDVLSLIRQTKGSAGRDVQPKQSREGVTEHRLRRPDGSELQVECYGKEDAPPIIRLTVGGRTVRSGTI